MNFAKHLFILEVIESLHRHGSWTGKTHVQKALAILAQSSEIEVPFDFVLYKHGPYSFDVDGELEQMRSYSAIDVSPNVEGYGVTLRPSVLAGFVKKHARLSRNEKVAIDRVCKFTGKRNVTELERLATAAWIRYRECINTSDDVAKRLNTLKPHVSIEDAKAADREIERFFREIARHG